MFAPKNHIGGCPVTCFRRLKATTKNGPRRVTSAGPFLREIFRFLLDVDSGGSFVGCEEEIHSCFSECSCLRHGALNSPWYNQLID